MDSLTLMVPARPPPYADRLHSTQGATIRTLLDDLTRKYEGMGELMFATPDTIRDLLTFSRMAGMSISYPCWTPYSKTGT